MIRKERGSIFAEAADFNMHIKNSTFDKHSVNVYWVRIQ